LLLASGAGKGSKPPINFARLALGTGSCAHSPWYPSVYLAEYVPLTRNAVGVGTTRIEDNKLLSELTTYVHLMCPYSLGA